MFSINVKDLGIKVNPDIIDIKGYHLGLRRELRTDKSPL